MSVGTRETRVSARKRRGGAISLAASATQTRQGPRAGRSSSLLRSLGERLTPHEWRRRLMHMSPGLLPFVLLAVPHADPVTWLLQLPVVLLTTGLVIFALSKERLFARSGERGWVTSVVSYGIITSTLLVGFPRQLELGMVVTIIIAFGDGSATLAGLIARGRRLPWNDAKSWVGLSAFLACSVPLATLVYWREARPGVSPWVALACVVPAALTAALAESLPTRINDNIRVGVTAGLTILLTHGMFVGW